MTGKKLSSCESVDELKEYGLKTADSRVLFKDIQKWTDEGVPMEFLRGRMSSTVPDSEPVSGQSQASMFSSIKFGSGNSASSNSAGHSSGANPILQAANLGDKMIAIKHSHYRNFPFSVSGFVPVQFERRHVAVASFEPLPIEVAPSFFLQDGSKNPQASMISNDSGIAKCKEHNV